MLMETDLLEYLQTFENHMKLLKVPQEGWSNHLMPLLNDECRATVSFLDAADKESYKVLKEELVSNSSENVRRASETFWNLERKKGQPFPHVVKILTRLANRFATGDTIREALDKVVWRNFYRCFHNQQQQIFGRKSQQQLRKLHAWPSAISRIVTGIQGEAPHPQAELPDC